MTIKKIHIIRKERKCKLAIYLTKRTLLMLSRKRRLVRFRKTISSVFLRGGLKKPKPKTDKKVKTPAVITNKTQEDA